MYIVDPDKRYKDGSYYVDYGAAALAMISYLRWRYILENTKIEKVTEASYLFIGKQERWDVSVDFDEATRVANVQAWAWIPKFYAWMDSRKLTGEEVLASVLSIAKQADSIKRTWEARNNAVYSAANQSREAVVANLGTGISVLEGLRDGSKAVISILSAVNPAGVAIKGAITGTELVSKGVPLSNTVLAVGTDLLIDFGKKAGKVGQTFAITANGVNKGVQAYISGKNLPESAVVALAEVVGEVCGKGGKAVYPWFKRQLDPLMIPLIARGTPGATALSKVLGETYAPEVAKKTAKEIATTIAKTRLGGLAKGRQEDSGGELDASKILIGGSGHFEQLIRSGIYKVG